MLCLVHIPKTGGTSLNDCLRRTFGRHYLEVEPWIDIRRCIGPADLRLLRTRMPWVRHISSHYVRAYSGLETVAPDIQYITWLREPQACYRSTYNHARYRNYRFGSVPEFLAYRAWHNRQTKFIAGEANLEKAKELLTQRFAFVGLTERMDESIRLMRVLLAASLPPLLAPIRRMNIGVSGQEREQDDLYWERYRDLILEANETDLALYDFVEKELFPDFMTKARDLGLVESEPREAVAKHPKVRASYQKICRYYYKISLLLYRRYGKKRNIVDNGEDALTFDCFPEYVF